MPLLMLGPASFGSGRERQQCAPWAGGSQWMARAGSEHPEPVWVDPKAAGLGITAAIVVVVVGTLVRAGVRLTRVDLASRWQLIDLPVLPKPTARPAPASALARFRVARWSVTVCPGEDAATTG